MSETSRKVINGITWYRIIAAPVLLILILTGNINLFKWLILLSYFTDLIDGYLARKFRVVSRFGARIDSIGDDLTVLVSLIGLIVLKPGFILEHMYELGGILILFVLQTIWAISKFGKVTSFHTILAKVSAILQGLFFILVFLLPEPLSGLYYLALVFTALDITEEIILVAVLPKWKADVKGLYWVVKGRMHLGRERED